MQISEEATEYLYLKADTPSEWDCCDFALVRITPEWLGRLEERLALLYPFESREDFYSHEYWDAPDGYFVHGQDEEIPDTQLLDDDEQSWCFADLDTAEMETFTKPESRLSAHQLVVTKGGYAYFTALGKHTDEQYFTAGFAIRELLDRCRSVSYSGLKR